MSDAIRMADVPTVGSVVRAARKARGIGSQTELADRAGLSLDTVSRIERGENGTIESLDAIAKALEYEDAVSMFRAVDAPDPAKLTVDARKIVKMLPALNVQQLKRLRASVREMIDADEE
jgi:transcriptional regulator with XRE-family HTH domain